jgi:hypothetical protein
MDMKCLKECAMPGCRENGLGDRYKSTYCAGHGGEDAFKARAVPLSFVLPGWFPGQPVTLGAFEGMPVKLALKLRKAAAKPVKAIPFKASTVPCPHCQGSGRVTGHVAMLAAVA